jgi:hypothetical protein
MNYPSGFSHHINLRKFEKESRRLLKAGFVFAVFFYLALGVFITIRYPTRVVHISTKIERRITTDLIPIPSRPQNPYDSWRGPRSFRNSGRPGFMFRMPNAPAGGIAFKQPQKFGEGAIRFRGDEYGADIETLIRRIVASGRLTPKKPIAEPKPYVPEPYHPFVPRREYWRGQNRVSMKDEMIRIEDLNTGKYKGVIVLNLSDERDIKGYLYIPSSVRGDSLGAPRSLRRYSTGLAEILKKYTKIIAISDKQIELSSPDIQNYPFIYLGADAAFSLSEYELSNLGLFLNNGGFAFIEAYGGKGSGALPVAAGSLRAMIRGALGQSGELRPIPNDHAIYHCFFEFPDGPPRKEREESEAPSGQSTVFLEGAWIGDRLAAVYSEKGYGEAWADPKGNEAFRKMGANLVMFALTQAGGSTVRIVDDSGR